MRARQLGMVAGATLALAGGGITGHRILHSRAERKLAATRPATSADKPAPIPAPAAAVPAAPPEDSAAEREARLLARMQGGVPTGVVIPPRPVIAEPVRESDRAQAGAAGALRRPVRPGRMAWAPIAEIDPPPGPRPVAPRPPARPLEVPGQLDRWGE